MYGLPQAGRIAYEKLIKHLATGGYLPEGITPGLFKHTTKPIYFSLIVDNLGVKCINKQDAAHLVDHINKAYTTTVDWTGKVYAGFHLDWNYIDRTVNLSMPGYVKGSCRDFHHPTPLVPEHFPHPWNVPTYGAKQQKSDLIIKKKLCIETEDSKM